MAQLSAMSELPQIGVQIGEAPALHPLSHATGVIDD
jgi:hypothetical protein